MAYKNYKRDRSGTTSLIPFVVFSLLFHGILLFVKIDAGSSSDDSTVAIKYYDLNDATPVPPEKAVPEKPGEDLLKGQVVDIARPEIQKKPEKSRYLSEYDSSVSKETKSDFDNNINIRDKKLRKKLSETIQRETDTEERKEDVVSGPENNALTMRQEKVKKGEMKGFEGSDGKYLRGGEKEKSGLVNAEDALDQEGSQMIGGHRIPNRFLPYMNGNDTLLTTPSNDFLKDVEKGDETALNARKFIYSAYFNKIKQAISQHWTPSYVLMINDPGGHVYGKKDRLTKLIVHISSSGTLISAKVDVSSGIDFLDREAINAFKMASPFSPPPEVLLNSQNLLEIHFSFMVIVE
ncbi:MAG TPA: TonB family protein [bacterium]|nr:TonB family protein [bacterium]